MTDRTGLRDAALRHLWMQSGGWADMEGSGDPIIVAEARGLEVFDTEGRRWLDVNGGYASVTVGYGRTEIADAALRQMTELAYYPEQTVTPPTVRLAERIGRLAPGDLERSWLVSGGSEANETAIKMARAYHARGGQAGRFKVISRRGSYHGATAGVAWLGRAGPAPFYDGEPAPLGLAYAPQPNPYRCEMGGQTPSECAVLCAGALERVILSEGPETVAAVIGEPINSSAGAIVPGDEYWPMVREICDRYGVLLICDEVVCGFGRTGKMFGIEHYGVVPDLMTLAKGLGSSYVPVGSVVATRDVAGAFVGEGNAFHAALTAGGHPVATAAALANLDIIEQEGMVGRSSELGDHFLGMLSDMLRSNSLVGDVRGRGLLVGVELVSDRDTKAGFPESLRLPVKMMKRFRERGLLLRMLGPQVLQMAPPLCVTRAELGEIATAVCGVLSEMESELAAA